MFLQSKNGGFPAWEPNHAFRWMEVSFTLRLLFQFLLSSSWCHKLALFMREKKNQPSYNKFVFPDLQGFNPTEIFEDVLIEGE